MANYKTHSIHSELVFNNIDKKTNIEKDDLKVFAFGPDALITTDYKLFDYQHSHRTRDYFESLLRTIKEKKLQDNEKVMAFLYGQLDHFVLDVVIHPLIYYMTECMPVKYKIKPHALIEMWIDDYVMSKYGRIDETYYRNGIVLNKELRDMIDTSYKKIYNCQNASIKYDIGIFNLVYFDSVRFSKSPFLKRICRRLRLGDFFYNRNSRRSHPFLNFNHQRMTNPVTGEVIISSFNDLWDESIDVASELIDDVNRYLYMDKPLNNHLIKGNISYNTGLPCREKEIFRFVKKYKK